MFIAGDRDHETRMVPLPVLASSSVKPHVVLVGNDILKESMGSQPEGVPESSRGSKRSGAPRNQSINESPPQGVPDRLCDPSRVKTQLPPESGGVASLNPRLLSRS